MAGLINVREAASAIVGPVLGHRARFLREGDVGRILHAYLISQYGGVKAEYPVRMGTYKGEIDFRFGDWPHGSNPCVVELAVRNTDHGPQLLCSQNESELKKLSRFPATRAQTRVLLLMDIGHRAIPEKNLRPGYDNFTLGPGQFQRRSVSVLYVHRDINYRFVWKP